MPITFRKGYGSRANLEIRLDQDVMKINQHKCLSNKKSGDIEPYELISGYYRTLSQDRNRKIFDLYKAGKESISSIDDGLQDFDNQILIDLIDELNFKEMVAYMIGVVTVPQVIRNMNKNQIDKVAVSSYNTTEYIEICTLIVMFTGLSPLLAYMLARVGHDTGEYAYTLIHKLLMKSDMFANSSIYEKYIGHVRKVTNSHGNKGYQIHRILSGDGVVYSLGISSILGRLGTHNIPEDDDNKNVPSRIFNVISGKSKPPVSKSGGVVNDDISIYDIRKPFLITGNIEEEDIWMTDDPYRFAEQYGKLTDKQAADLEFGLSRVDGYMTDPILCIMAVLLREYIDPRAIQVLGIGRSGKPDSKHINCCRATAYMLSVDMEDKYFSKLMLAKHVSTDDEVTLFRTENRNVSFDSIKDSYTFSKGEKESPVMVTINKVSDLIKTSEYLDMTTEVPEVLESGINVKIRLAEFFNEQGK